MAIKAPTTIRDAGDFLPERYERLHFSDQDWAWFREQSQALDIPDADLHRDTAERLYSHLVGVNAWLNLTRLTDPAGYLKFQLLDSLSVLPTIAPMLEEHDTVVDLGSGGGYPALPLMTWLDSQDFVLVDSRQKKVEFLNASIPIIPRSGKGVAVATRGRDIGRVRPDLEHHAAMVTARAVGRGADLLEDAAALLAVGGVFVQLKGPSWPVDEAPDFQEACEAYGFEQVDDVVLTLVPDDPEHHIILAVKKGKGDAKLIRRLKKRK